MHRAKPHLGWALAALALIAATLAVGVSSVGATGSSPTHIQVRFHPVNNSGVSGIVDLRQLRSGGTSIHVVAFGLKPGGEYLSLYYDNHTCQLEPYSVNDVIGGIYTANVVGVGTTSGEVEDPLSTINSVSVRKADFTLVACANVHPGT